MLTKEMLQKIRPDFEDAMKQLEEKYGVRISLGKLTYDSNSAGGKLTILDIGDGGDVFSKERDDFIKHAIIYGLKSEWIDGKFKHNGKSFEISGLKTRNSKLPVLAKNVKTGKVYKFPTDLIVSKMS